jgi:hypothetical protein
MNHFNVQFTEVLISSYTDHLSRFRTVILSVDKTEFAGRTRRRVRLPLLALFKYQFSL